MRGYVTSAVWSEYVSMTAHNHTVDIYIHFHMDMLIVFFCVFLRAFPQFVVFFFFYFYICVFVVTWYWMSHIRAKENSSGKSLSHGSWHRPSYVSRGVGNNEVKWTWRWSTQSNSSNYSRLRRGELCQLWILTQLLHPWYCTEGRPVWWHVCLCCVHSHYFYS